MDTQKKYKANHRKGEGYLDVAINVLVTSMILFISLNLFTFFYDYSKVSNVADQMARFCANEGTISGTAVTKEYEDLLAKYNLSAEKNGVQISYTGTVNAGEKFPEGTVQHGDPIIVKVTAKTKLPLIGSEGSKIFTIKAVKTTSGERFWKTGEDYSDTSGDVNGDGVVNQVDVTLLSQYISSRMANLAANNLIFRSKPAYITAGASMSADKTKITATHPAGTTWSGWYGIKVKLKPNTTYTVKVKNLVVSDESPAILDIYSYTAEPSMLAEAQFGETKLSRYYTYATSFLTFKTAADREWYSFFKSVGGASASPVTVTIEELQIIEGPFAMPIYAPAGESVPFVDSSFSIYAADVNHNGTVDAADIAEIQRIISQAQA